MYYERTATLKISSSKQSRNQTNALTILLDTHDFLLKENMAAFNQISCNVKFWV